MADGILTPCNVEWSWHWFLQVTAPCNEACGSGIVTVNSSSGNTLQCDTDVADLRHLGFYGSNNGILKKPMYDFLYRSSIYTDHSSKLLSFLRKWRFLYFGDIWTYRQTDRQTDEQTDSIDALSRSRCRERRLNKARYWSKNANFSYLLVGLFNLHDFIELLWIFAQNINTNCSSSWTIRRCKNIAEKFKSLVQQRFRQTGDRRTARAIARSLTSIFAVMLVASQCAVDTTHTWVDAAIRSPRTVITDSQGYF